MRDDLSGVQRRGNGFAVAGHGFYVWDEDMNEVLRAARELRRGRVTRPPRRMLVVRPGGLPGPTRDPEALDA